MYVVGYHWNLLDEPVIVAGSKPMLTEFGIHHTLESCDLDKEVVYVEIERGSSLEPKESEEYGRSSSPATLVIDTPTNQ